MRTNDSRTPRRCTRCPRLPTTRSTFHCLIFIYHSGDQQHQAAVHQVYVSFHLPSDLLANLSTRASKMFLRIGLPYHTFYSSNFPRFTCCFFSLFASWAWCPFNSISLFVGVALPSISLYLLHIPCMALLFYLIKLIFLSHEGPDHSFANASLPKCKY